jgi:hypothetical protein
MPYTAGIEVSDREAFSWVCPAKAKAATYEGWQERLFAAAKIFARGNVDAGLAAGDGTASPYGFESEAGKIKAALKEAETLREKGGFVAACIRRALKGSPFLQSKGSRPGALRPPFGGPERFERETRPFA